MVTISKEKATQEILDLFESQLSLLTRMDKLEKMGLRKRIRNVIQPTMALNLRHSKVFITIMEDKLNDVFSLFHDGLGFKKKLVRKIDQLFK